MTSNRAWLFLAACLVSPLTAASANVMTDWDEKAVALIQLRVVPPVAYRAMAIVHLAMFDAVNSIEPTYQPYYSRNGCWHGAGLRQGQWARGASEGHGYDDGSLLREENDVN